MSARIYLHPRSAEGVLAACRRFNRMGYWMVSTLHGYIELRRITPQVSRYFKQLSERWNNEQ